MGNPGGTIDSKSFHSVDQMALYHEVMYFGETDIYEIQVEEQKHTIQTEDAPLLTSTPHQWRIIESRQIKRAEIPSSRLGFRRH
ncbi:hypothetical protein TNCV_2597811 [Trichonephila clavipes]|nr:hypothetical protein TNCV_2597811 [Trichonephila clavipes]